MKPESPRDPAATPSNPEKPSDQAPSAPGATPPAAAGQTVEALHERWLRAEAELQNFRRRAGRELEETRRRAEEAVFLELLGVSDDLERALRGAPAATPDASWAEGVALVVRRIQDYLRRQGIQVVDPQGEPFDPAFHEALFEVDGGERVRPGTVAEVLVKGYRRGDRALRPARVVVARDHGPQASPAPSEFEEPADGEG